MKKKPAQKYNLDYFIIDATNVCYWEDTSAPPSLNPLLQLLVCLHQRQYNFFCIFDASTPRKLLDRHRDIYERLLTNKEYFHQIMGGKKADGFVLELAHRYGASVISNDQYQEPRYNKYTWKEREALPQRLFMGEVINFMGNRHLILADLDVNTTIEPSTDKLFEELSSYIFPNDTNILSGKVKFYNVNEGWGLITYETDVYVTAGNIKNNLTVGQQVQFTIAENERGIFALNIKEIPSKEPQRVTGLIDSYDDRNTSGTIKVDSTGEIIFFYRSYFRDAIAGDINKGMPISFVIGNNKNGLCAREISIILPTPEEKELRSRLHRLEVDLRNKDNDLKAKDNTIQQLRQRIGNLQQNAEQKLVTTTNNANTNTNTNGNGNGGPKNEQKPLQDIQNQPVNSEISNKNEINAEPPSLQTIPVFNSTEKTPQQKQQQPHKQQTNKQGQPQTKNKISSLVKKEGKKEELKLHEPANENNNLINPDEVNPTINVVADTLTNQQQSKNEQVNTAPQKTIQPANQQPVPSKKRLIIPGKIELPTITQTHTPQLSTPENNITTTTDTNNNTQSPALQTPEIIKEETPNTIEKTKEKATIADEKITINKNDTRAKGKQTAKEKNEAAKESTKKVIKKSTAPIAQDTIITSSPPVTPTELAPPVVINTPPQKTDEAKTSVQPKVKKQKQQQPTSKDKTVENKEKPKLIKQTTAEKTTKEKQLNTIDAHSKTPLPVAGKKKNPDTDSKKITAVKKTTVPTVKTAGIPSSKISTRDKKASGKNS
ncbi:MAG: cold shock domain-containing protein [Sphingobacteriales bacterium]|nr:cold shock domain-containing protein [Sphingobacteriales bacterium]